MPKTKVYEPEFKKKIVQLYLEKGRTIKTTLRRKPQTIGGTEKENCILKKSGHILRKRNRIE